MLIIFLLHLEEIFDDFLLSHLWEIDKKIITGNTRSSAYWLFYLCWIKNANMNINRSLNALKIEIIFWQTASILVLFFKALFFPTQVPMFKDDLVKEDVSEFRCNRWPRLRLQFVTKNVGGPEVGPEQPLDKPPGVLEWLLW